MAILLKLRKIAFATSFVLSLVMFIVSVTFIANVNKAAGGLVSLSNVNKAAGGLVSSLMPFSGLCLATAIITALSIPALYLVTTVMKGPAIPLNVLIEFAWLSILWVLWIASAGSVAPLDTVFSSLPCSYNHAQLPTWGSLDELNDFKMPVCHEGKAMIAFGFLNWLVLTFYNFTFLYFIIRSQLATGSTAVWSSTIKDFDWDVTKPVQGQVQSNWAPQAGTPVVQAQTPYGSSMHLTSTQQPAPYPSQQV